MDGMRYADNFISAADKAEKIWRILDTIGLIDKAISVGHSIDAYVGLVEVTSGVAVATEFKNVNRKYRGVSLRWSASSNTAAALYSNVTSNVARNLLREGKSNNSELLAVPFATTPVSISRLKP